MPSDPHDEDLTDAERDAVVLRTTVVFNTFVWCQLFNEINARKLNNGKIFI
jgi:hypothetical protein